MQQKNLLDTVCVNPRNKPKASVIWLHGLGADGHDFENIVPALMLPEELAVRFVFPHAPIRPVSINGGYPMRAWFDIFSLQQSGQEDEEGIKDASKQIEALIQYEMATYDLRANNIVLAGFSQGGALALYYGLHHPEPLAGILALSTFLPLALQLPQTALPVNKSVPIMMAHGTMDNVVALTYGLQSCDYLKALGYNVNWHTYPMAHSVSQQEVQDIGEWLVQVFKYK